MVLSEVDGFGFDMISVETRIPGKKRDRRDKSGKRDLLGK
jgi:hypothetical protein